LDTSASAAGALSTETADERADNTTEDLTESEDARCESRSTSRAERLLTSSSPAGAATAGAATMDSLRGEDAAEGAPAGAAKMDSLRTVAADEADDCLDRRASDFSESADARGETRPGRRTER
jgi:hypothetical protein